MASSIAANGVAEFAVILEVFHLPLKSRPLDDLNDTRGAWGRKREYILSCIGFAVGLGNIWRFPYLCLKHCGGKLLLKVCHSIVKRIKLTYNCASILIPYTIMTVLVGLPLFLLELSFGQFASQGPIAIWSVSPLFKGQFCDWQTK